MIDLMSAVAAAPRVSVCVHLLGAMLLVVAAGSGLR